jgi:N-acetylglucosamine transport system substrate-binding protein
MKLSRRLGFGAGVLVLAGALVVGMGGCTKPGDAGTGGGGEDAPAKVTEVMVFEGGYGKDFYETAASEFTEKTKNEVKVIGDPRIDQQLMPRMQKGDPPALAYPGWRFDSWKAVQDGAVEDLTAALKEPAYGSETPWGETFNQGLLKLGQKDGKQYLMPYFFSVFGWWYDPDLFEAKGWKVPTTYAELLALCQQMKAAGMAPITYQGQYPDYMLSGMVQPWIISAGGMEAMDACQNLEPGAWNSKPVIKAATMIRELRDMGYFQSGATALSHTEAQAEFLNHRAAMIPCGTWLYSEMKKEMPEGRRIKFFLPPVLGDGQGDPTAMMVKIEPWFVPSGSKNKKISIDFFKYLTSKEKATQFVVEKGTFMAINDSDPKDMPEDLASAAVFYKSSNKLWASQWREWYPDFYKIVGDILTELLNGKLTPEEFGAKVEAAAEKVRKDDSVSKYKYSSN